MFLGWKAGLGLNNMEKLSSLNTRQLGLTDGATNHLAGLAKTMASKSRLKRGSRGSLDIQYKPEERSEAWC